MPASFPCSGKNEGSVQSTIATVRCVGRIMAGNKFHYSVGQRELPQGEPRWRVALIEKALASLETLVQQPEIFESADLQKQRQPAHSK
jgi:hypothetical protein